MVDIGRGLNLALTYVVHVNYPQADGFDPTVSETPRPDVRRGVFFWSIGAALGQWVSLNGRRRIRHQPSDRPKTYRRQPPSEGPPRHEPSRHNRRRAGVRQPERPYYLPARTTARPP